ncbi:MAG: BatA domain-containing protein [Planctomycetales bacterium]|nr:BatA domain-containing protein [Planctomycetales bacterium]
MIWSNPSLIFGALLIAAPIALHLLMRKRPKRMEFPAIRFVAARSQSTSRRMQLQQLVLLALRCFAIAALALALARPSISSATASRWAIAGLLTVTGIGLALLAGAAANERRRIADPKHQQWLIRGLLTAAALLSASGLVLGGLALAGSEAMLGDRQAPSAVAMVFDTSPRMELLHANRTSIGRAQQLALRLLPELPAESQLAVLDSRREGAYWAADRGAARAAIDRLESTGAPEPLPQLLLDALDLVGQSELARREVYVFTDLTGAAWPAGQRELLESALRSAPNVELYVMDVGVRAPTNLALGDLKLSAVTLPRGGELRVTTQLSSVGLPGDHRVRLELEEPGNELPQLDGGEIRLPAARPRDRAQVVVPEGGSTQIELAVTVDSPGVRQGRVVIETATGDSLPVDNVRHFTVEVRDAWPVLLATGPNARADFVEQALAPADFRDFACTVVEQDQLPGIDLQQYAAICLLDPAPPEDTVWNALEQYVVEGGAVWIQLGRNARSDLHFNGAAPQRLLGAPLTRQWRSPDRQLFLDLSGGAASGHAVDRGHPALRYFMGDGVVAPWPSLPVFKHWVLEPLPPHARLLAGYSANSHAAMFERPLGQGNVVVSTTPLSDVVYSKNAWNELAYGENNWPPFILCNELMLHLARGADQPLNFSTGETVALKNDERTLPRRYQLFLPDEPPQEVTSRDSVLRMPYTVSPGAYRLKGDRGGAVIRGFSCNLPAAATRLDRLTESQLRERVGATPFQLADDYEQLQRAQNRQRVGREFFSVLMVLAACLLAIECLVSNRFYRSTQLARSRTLGAADSGQEQLTGGAA